MLAYKFYNNNVWYSIGFDGFKELYVIVLI